MQLDLVPIAPLELLTPRLRLRPLTEFDRVPFLAFDRENAAFFARYSPPPPGIDGPHAAFDRMLARAHDGLTAGTGFRLALFLHSTGELIGQVSLSDITRGVAQRCNIGYRIGERFARQGYMTEALTALLNYALSPAPPGLGLHRIECSVQPDNTPSLNLALKLGFQPEGHFKSFLFIAGAWRDHLILAKTASGPTS